MPRRQITEKLYQDLLVAYRERPGNHTAAARHAGCGRRMAKRAWELGWDRIRWAVPIKHVLEEETAATRARIGNVDVAEALELREEAAKAKAQALAARAEEGVLVQTSRRATLALLREVTQLIKMAPQLTAKVRTAIGDGRMRPAESLAALERIARLGAQVVSIGREAMRMERLYLGQPEAILGLAGEELSLEQAVHDIEQANAILEYAKQRGLVVHDGGLSGTQGQAPARMIDVTPAKDSGNGTGG